MSGALPSFLVLPGGVLLFSATVFALVGFLLRGRSVLSVGLAVMAGACMVPLASGWALAVGALTAAALLVTLRADVPRSAAISASALPGLGAAALTSLATIHGVPAEVAAPACAVALVGAMAWASGRAPGLIVGLITAACTLLFAAEQDLESAGRQTPPAEERSLT